MRDEVRMMMLELLKQEIFNASSVHGEGREARAKIAEARNAVAEMAGTSSDHVIFTSSASEAANLALTPHYLHGKHEIKFAKAFVSAIEHPCVLSGGRFGSENIEYLKVDSEGVIDLNALKVAMAPFKAVYDALEDKNDPSYQPPFVAVMLANNETGVVEPVYEVAEIVHETGGFLLVDAVQGAGKLILDIESLEADALLLSAHKIGGPQGVGALILKSTAYKPYPLVRGGGQENHHRAGTENVLAIAGFGKAAKIAMDEFAEVNERIVELRNALELALVQSLDNNQSDLLVFAQTAKRLGNTLCFALKGLNAETALIGFDLAGIAISSGSACSSGKVKSSHVLKAMEVEDDLAQCALRISLGWNTQKEDVDGFINAWSSQVKRLYEAA